MTEAAVSSKLRVALNALGAVCWKVSDRFHASRPDLVICYRGRFIAIETKIYPNNPTALQDLTLYELVKAEATVYVARYNKTTKWLSLLDLSEGHETDFKDIRMAAQWLLRPLC